MHGAITAMSNSRLARYAAVGIAATVVHYALLVTMVEVGWLRPPVAAALGAVAGAQVAFAGNAWLTFRGAAVTLGAWWRFQLTALVGALLSFGLVAAGQRIGVHYLVAQVVATLVAMLATYEINRRWSFAVPRPSRE